MDSSTAPNTPEKTPATPSRVRRSFTVPAKLDPLRTPPAASTSVADNVETLYTHWFAKVVNFTSSGSVSRRDSAASAAQAENDDAGTLPWATPTERTIAAGPLRIYRVPNSVAFLNSGPLLHPILPKSQCWCVDGESKFVLRIRLNSYYRIELPFSSEEEKAKVEEFKGVLDNVLQYEKTPCPFQRGFVVELPEKPQAPVRRKSRYSSAGRVKRWKFDQQDKIWEREDTERRRPPESEAGDAGSASISEEDDDAASIITTSTRDESIRNESPSPQPLPRIQKTRNGIPKINIEERRRALFGERSVSASPDLRHSTPASSSSSLPAQDATPPESVEATLKPNPAAPVRPTLSQTPSVDSFYSLDSSNERAQSDPSIIESSASIYDDALAEPEGAGARTASSPKRQEPRLTVTTTEGTCETASKTPTALSSDGRPSSAPSTPTLMSDSEDSLELPLPDVPTPPDTIRLRRLTGTSQRRALSPMPPAANLFTPSKPQQQHNNSRHMTTLLVQKTCSIILGPPANLVSLMIRIAAKIAAGTFGLDSYYLGQRSLRVPGTWESSGDEDDWAEDEDDFGIALDNLGSGAERRRGGQNTSEVD